MDKPAIPPAIQAAESLENPALRSSSGLQPAGSYPEKNGASATGLLAGTANQPFSVTGRPPLPIGGYVLAGGRSTRMGTDKALLQLAGKPLIEHAVKKLRRFCAEVHILSSNLALASYAPLVPDLHPDCGPLGGMEAALLHSAHDWNLILPVDVPFIPTIFLDMHATVNAAPNPPFFCRIELFTVQGRPQPAVCFLHKEVAPNISAAIERGDFKLLPLLEAAAEALAIKHNQPLHQVLRITPITNEFNFSGTAGQDRRPTTDAQNSAIDLWFANLNTHEDFVDAERHADALDT